MSSIVCNRPFPIIILILNKDAILKILWGERPLDAKLLEYSWTCWWFHGSKLIRIVLLFKYSDPKKAIKKFEISTFFRYTRVFQLKLTTFARSIVKWPKLYGKVCQSSQFYLEHASSILWIPPVWRVGKYDWEIEISKLSTLLWGAVGSPIKKLSCNAPQWIDSNAQLSLTIPDER